MQGTTIQNIQTILMHSTKFNLSFMEKISYFTFVTEKNNSVHPYKESPFNFAQVVAVISKYPMHFVFNYKLNGQNPLVYSINQTMTFMSHNSFQFQMNPLHHEPPL